MTFGVEAVGGGSALGGGDVTAAFTVTSANLLLVGVGIGVSGGASYPNSVTWNGTAMTAIASSDASDGSWTGFRWYRLFSPAAGTFNVVVDSASNVTSAHIVSFTDADIAGTPLGTPSVATNTTANPAVTVADSASGNIVVAGMCTDGSGVATTEANTIIFEIENLDSDVDMNAQYKTATGANTVMSWTNSTTGDGWAASGVAVKAAGGGGGGLRRKGSLGLLGVGR